MRPQRDVPHAYRHPCLQAPFGTTTTGLRTKRERPVSTSKHMFAKLAPQGGRRLLPQGVSTMGVVLDSDDNRKQVRAARRALGKGPAQNAKRLQKARKIAEHRNRNCGGIKNGECVAPFMCVCVALVVVLWSF